MHSKRINRNIFSGNEPTFFMNLTFVFREKLSGRLLLYDLYDENCNFKDGRHLDSLQLAINLILFIEARIGVSK